MGKKLMVLALAALLAGLLVVTLAMADPPGWAGPPFGQETYLFPKNQLAQGVPWTIIRPDTSTGSFPTYDGIPFGKLEYFNWTDSGDFCFDFKGYNLTEGTEYALIYYNDPGPGAWPLGYADVYVLGMATAASISTGGKGRWATTNMGVHIDGCCTLGFNLPPDPGETPNYTDANYPNAVKVWLVEKSLLSDAADDGINACSWEKMTGWPSTEELAAGAILFETSLITFEENP